VSNGKNARKKVVNLEKCSMGEELDMMKDVCKNKESAAKQSKEVVNEI
jgi:hypothetical protein